MIRSQLPMPKYRSMPLTVKRAIILWISIFQFADALPTIRRDLSSRSIASGEAVGVTYRPECTKAVLASIGWETKSSSESGKQWLTVYGGAEAYAKEWCKQIQQNWIDESYSCQGHGKPRQDPFLSDDLTSEIVYRKRLPMSGQLKTGNTGDLGYFTLPGAQGPDHDEYRILKLLDLGTIPGCEKCSLQAFTTDIAKAGYAFVNRHKVGVLIMTVKDENVTPLTQLSWWKGLSVEKKARVLELFQEKAREATVQLLNEGKHLNGNFGPNELVTDEKARNIYFINYAYPGILKLRFKPDERAFLFWFLERWYFLWKHVYHDAGVEIPSQASITVEVDKMLKTQGNIPVEGAGGKISKVNK